MEGIPFIPLHKWHLFYVSVAFQPVEGIFNFALAYYHTKYPSQLYVVEKSDKHSSDVYFEAINKNLE